jgi:aldehyde dehydrogenase (NAD+)
MSEIQFTDTLHQNHERAIEQATANVEFNAWIDGESYETDGERRFETYDPAINDTITSVPRCAAEDVDTGVEAAKRAFEGEWSTMTVAERTNRILEWVEKLRDHTDELAVLESLDTGKPLDNAEYETGRALDFIEYYAHIVRGDQGSQIPIADDAHAYTRNEPYGVVGLIVPWNYPLLLTSWKLGPALAAGNTVVLKPAENTPLTATRIAQLSADILPEGVLNIVHGFGDEVGVPITNHSDIQKISFTGEDSTGEAVMEAAAGQITPVTLELGGKSPLLVFPDADLEEAVSIAAEGIFYNTGQSCDAFSRTLVHEEIHDEFVELFVEAAANHQVGDPLQDTTTMGPLASEQQYQKFTKYVDLGTDAGATLAYGGNASTNERCQDGWFVEPTIFDDVDNDMQIAQEEIFGPVASVISFSDYAEAIEIANDVDHGLVAGIATDDLSLAHRAAAEIEAGTVWINQSSRIVPGTPFGGYKRSGIGRECGKEALDQYRQTKTINVGLNEPEL